MPAPTITKASFSNVIAALREHGLTPHRIDLIANGTFSIQLGAPVSVANTTEEKPKLKKWVG